MNDPNNRNPGQQREQQQREQQQRQNQQPGQKPDPKAPVTYKDHVLPVLRKHCLNCHNADKARPT